MTQDNVKLLRKLGAVQYHINQAEISFRRAQHYHADAMRLAKELESMIRDMTPTQDPTPSDDDTQEVTPQANGSQPQATVTGTPLDQVRAVATLNNFVVLDTETTGLRDGEICQIAIIDHEGNTLLDQMVKPVHPIPADATRIHGITNDQVKAAPGWSEVAPRVVEILTGKDVIVYNAVYDRKMMHRAAEHAGMPKIDWKALSSWYCAMEAYAEYHGDWNDYHQSYRWQRLAVAAERCGVEVKNAHNALGDCLMTLGVIRHMQRA